MTLEELKKRATAGELALIEKVEATLQADIRREMYDDLSVSLTSMPPKTRTFCFGCGHIGSR